MPHDTLDTFSIPCSKKKYFYQQFSKHGYKQKQFLSGGYHLYRLYQLPDIGSLTKVS
jgi:hypothetical protein